MLNSRKCAKINLKVLIILVLVMVALGVSLVAARQVRRSLLAKMALDAGDAAYERKDWVTAYKQYQGYLARNPDDITILKKYAEAALSVKPLEGRTVMRAIAAYRRVLQLDPLDESACKELLRLYAGIGNFEELAYIAGKRLKDVPNDRQATLRLAEAWIGLNKNQQAQEILQELIDDLDALVPARHPEEYVRACVLMSQIIIADTSQADKTPALEKLDQAAKYAPESAEALVYFARFHRMTAKTFDAGYENVLATAREHLEKASGLKTDNPRVRLLLAEEWINHGEFDRAAAQLRDCDNLPQETVEQHYLDQDDWTAAKFLLASQLAIRSGAVADCKSLVDSVQKELPKERRRHRVVILPSIVRLCFAAGNASDARAYFEEYAKILDSRQGQTESARQELVYLKALVAKAENDSYAVIDVLQPEVTSNTARPQLWWMLADAYSRTDQPRRAVNAMLRYLRLRPTDAKVRQQLTMEYLRLRDFSRALQAARLAESLDPTDVVLKLLRLEASVNLAAEQTTSVRSDPQKAAQTVQRRKNLVKELAQLRAENPESVDIRILQAILANQLGQDQEAEDILKQAVEDCDDKLRAQMQLVRHYQKLGRKDRAIEVCNQARNSDPNVSEPWLALSRVHSTDGDYDAARICLREGLDSVVDRWEKRQLSIQLALLELMHGQKDSGTKLLTEVADQDKREVHARVLLLNVDQVRDDPDRVAELIGQLRDAEGETGLKWRFYQASAWLSSDLWRSKQRDIVSYFEYCILLDPEWSEPVLRLADLYERLKDFDRVEDTCRQALARNPSATEIADKLLVLLERQGRFADAEEFFRQTEVDAHLESRWTIRNALRTGELSRAIDELKARISNDDRDVASLILLARLTYAQSQDVTRAFGYLDKAEDPNQPSRAITAVRASILRAEGKSQEARKIIDDYVEARKDFNAYWMRAVYLTEQGDLEGARRDYMQLKTFAEQGVNSYVLLGGFYVRNGKLDDAVSTLQEALDLHPEHLGLKRMLMKTFFLRAGEHDQERALKILGELNNQLPEDPELKKLMALRMLQDGKPASVEAAKQRLEEVVEAEPTAVDAHLVLIGLAVDAGKHEQARDFAIRALGSNPNNVPLLVARGRAELALGNTQMAAEIARLAVQEDLNNAQARDLLLATARQSGDKGLLQEYRDQVESRLGGSPAGQEQLLISRAAVMTELESPQTAIPELEAFCRSEQASGSITAIVTLADLYRMSGDMDQAKLWIDRAERADPNGQTALQAKFLWLLSQNRFEELEGISSAYVAAKEQNPAAVLRAASELAGLESMTLKKEGLKLFEHAVTLTPKSKSARLGLAVTLYRTGNPDRAVKVYRQLLDEYPQDIQILNDLAWILQEHDQSYPAALELADRGLKADPDNLFLLDTRGTILAKMERYADAREDFEKAVELSPPDTARKAKALLRLGRICVKLDDLAEAKQNSSDALEIDKKIDVLTTEERSEITKIIEM